MSLIATALLAAVINVSSTTPRYFETSDGKPWIPIGCNICFDRLYGVAAHGDAEVRANFARWLRSFAENGGNCIRLWAGHRSLEVMPEKAGIYDPGRIETLKGIVELCEKLNIKVKITLESFRMCLNEDVERGKANPKRVNFSYNHVFNRPLYAPYADSVTAFFRSEECRRIYLGKAQFLKDLGFGDSSAVYCWELWNEINAAAPIADYAPWSAWALAELKKMFPNQMTVNNLGSFSDVGAYQMYDELATEKDNDFMQIHRYLDAGACLDVCRGPMDIVAASAVRELLDRRPDRPAILAEVGAVQANHAGPFPYYPFDKEGTLLHDALFAAFFAGAAGCGQFWHWDHQYIDGNNLWWHFRRFASAIEGLDPIAEGFKPFYTESRRLRMYGLQGKKTAVLWCRDKKSSWEDELVHGNRPETLVDEIVPFRNCELDCYLPWEDCRTTVHSPKLPPFKRSIVVRVQADAVEGVVRAH
ncbi:MAG: hypothetical protein MJ240_07155 [Kiritimatiellae bacterium]|nr:hypothetical protein [Kiritimatiellia bacterium]